MRLRSLIDAHCHLQEFPNFETIIEEAGRLNVTDFICNGIQEND